MFAGSLDQRVEGLAVLAPRPLLERLCKLTPVGRELIEGTFG